MEKHVRPIYKNSEITKYHINYQNELFVFYMTREMTENDAPTIVSYLEQFKPLLENRLDTYNENYPWFALHRQRDKSILNSPFKIVNSRRAKSNIFALEKNGYFEQSDLMITVVKDKFYDEFPPEYIIGLLNSKLYYVWLRNRGKVKGDMLELYGKPLEEIPIKKPDETTASGVARFVNEIIYHKTDEVLAMKSIDDLIYRLFDLSEKEIEIVEKYNA